MNALTTQIILIYILIAAIMIARPWLSRKNILFGVVFGSADIRRNPDAERIVSRFIIASLALAAALAAVFGLFLHFIPLDETGSVTLIPVSVFILIAVETVPYVLANRSLKKLKETLKDDNLVRDTITVEIGGDDPQKRPIAAALFLLLLVPVVITIVIAAVYYPALPDRIPTHFGFNGMADAFGDKSAGLLAGPVTAQIIIAAVMFLVGVFSRNATASVKGSPGAAPGYATFRRFLSYWILVFGLIIEANFIMVELMMVGAAQNVLFWNIAFLVLIAVSVVIMFIVFFRMRGEPTGKVYDDDSKWVWGLFYFNPSDPSVFVEKRNGIGRTINFGRPAAWVILAAIVLVIIFAGNLSGK